jgi:hypothetical protein
MSVESMGWEGCLGRASTPEDVVALAREFMAHWSPYEIELLPRALRPGKIVDAQDVAEFAYTLVCARSVADIVPGALVHRMSTFFSHAAARLSQIGS